MHYDSMPDVIVYTHRHTLTSLHHNTTFRYKYTYHDLSKLLVAGVANSNYEQISHHSIIIYYVIVLYIPLVQSATSLAFIYHA